MKVAAQAAHQRTRATYGALRLRRELAADGFAAGLGAVRRVRRGLDLRCVQRKRSFRVATTDSDHQSPVAPNLLAVERTPCAHFGMFTLTIENQNRMVDLARAFAPKSLSTPGLMAINFHRSLDGRKVINFGQWAFVDIDFNQLNQQPGFRDEDLYWKGVAEAEPDFFDIVAVETRR